MERISESEFRLTQAEYIRIRLKSVAHYQTDLKGDKYISRIDEATEFAIRALMNGETVNYIYNERSRQVRVQTKEDFANFEAVV